MDFLVRSTKISDEDSEEWRVTISVTSGQQIALSEHVFYLTEDERKELIRVLGGKDERKK